jgi:hypothetical protein
MSDSHKDSEFLGFKATEPNTQLQANTQLLKSMPLHARIHALLKLLIVNTEERRVYGELLNASMAEIHKMNPEFHTQLKEIERNRKDTSVETLNSVIREHNELASEVDSLRVQNNLLQDSVIKAQTELEIVRKQRDHFSATALPTSTTHPLQMFPTVPPYRPPYIPKSSFLDGIKATFGTITTEPAPAQPVPVSVINITEDNLDTKLLDRVDLSDDCRMYIGNLISCGFRFIRQRPITSNRKGDLNQYCQQNKLPIPVYENCVFAAGAISSSVTSVKVKLKDGQTLSLGAVSGNRSANEQLLADTILSSLPFQKQSGKIDHHTTRTRRSKEKRYQQQQRTFDAANRELGIKEKHSVMDAALSFEDFFDSHGYAPNLVRLVPVDLIRKALQLYISGYGLLHLQMIIRLNKQHLHMFGDEMPASKLVSRNVSAEPGAKRRKIIVQLWQDTLAKKHGISLYGFQPQSSKSKKAEPGFLDETVASAMRHAIETNKDQFKEIGSSMADGLLDSVKSKFTDIMSSVSTSLEKVLGFSPTWIKAGIIFVVVCGVLLTAFTLSQFILLARTIFEIKSMLQPEFDSWQPQGSEEEEKKAGIFMVDSLAYIVGSQSGVSVSDMVNSVNKTSRFMVSLQNIGTFLKTCWQILQKCIDFVFTKFTGYPFFESSKVTEVLLRAYEDFYVQITTLDVNAIPGDRSIGINFVAAYAKLQASFKEVAKTSLEQPVISRMQQILLLGYQKMLEVQTKLGTLKGRPQPVWVNFFGIPKQGKTLIAQACPFALASCLGKTITQGHIHTRNQADDFWSGYHNGTFALMYEDLFQNTDTLLRCKTANELFMARNIASMPINMADLSSKGTTFMEAPLIISSMNADIRNLTNLGVMSPAALFRRVDFNVLVELKPGTQPKTGLAALTFEDTNDMDFILVSEENVPSSGLYNSVTMPQKKGERLSWAGLMEKIYLKHQANHAQYLGSLNQIDWKSKFTFIPPVNPPPLPPPNPPPPNVPPSPPMGPAGGNSSNSSNTSVLSTSTHTATSTITTTTSSTEVTTTTLGENEKYDQYKKSLTTDFKDAWNSLSGLFTKKIDSLKDQPVLQPVDRQVPVPLSVKTQTELDMKFDDENPFALDKYIPPSSAPMYPQGPNLIQKVAIVIDRTMRPAINYLRSCGQKQCKHHEGMSVPAQEFFYRVWDYYNHRVILNYDWTQVKPLPCIYTWIDEVMLWARTNNETALLKMINSFYYTHWSSHCKIVYPNETMNPAHMVWNDVVIVPNVITHVPYKVESTATHVSEILGVPIKQIPWLHFSSGIVTDSFAVKYDQEVRRKLSWAMFETTELCKTLYEFQHLTYTDRVTTPKYMIPLVINMLARDKMLSDPQKDAVRALIIDGKSIDALEEHMAMINQARSGYKIIGCYAIVAALTAAIAGVFLSFGFQGYFSGQSAKYEKQRDQLKQYAKAKKNNRAAGRFVPQGRETDLPTMSENDPQASDLGRIILTKNLRIVEIVDPVKERSVNTWITMMKGNMGVGVLHVLEDLPTASYAKFWTGEGETEFMRIPIVSIKKEPDRDIAIYTFKLLDPVRDITKHLRDKPITDKLKGIARLSYDTGRDTVTLGNYVEPFGGISEYETGQRVRDVLRVNGFPNQASDCGKPYLVFNTHVDRKLIGIHIAGNGSDALVAPLYASDFVSEPDICINESEKLFVKQGLDSKIKIDIPELREHLPNMKHAYTCNRSPPQPMHTALEKTVITTGCHATIDEKVCWLQPPWPVTEKPAKLRPFDTENGRINPHEVAYRHLKGHTTPLPPPELDLPSMYDGCFSKNIDHHWVRMLTIEEAVFGVPELNIPSIDITTSPGFPWILETVKRKNLIDKDKRWIHPDLINEVNFLVSEAEAGRVVPHVTVHCLKDEPRDIEKSDLGQTRAFQIGSLQHLIFHRMSTGFWVFQTEHDQDSDISVGLNVYSTDWDKHYAEITKFEKDPKNAEVKAEDCRGWDLRYPPWFAFYVWMIACMVYNIKPKSKHGLCFLASVIQTFYGYVLMPNGKLHAAFYMKSGTFLTSFLNSVFNSVRERCMFLRLCMRQNLLLKFDDYISQKKFGDDGCAGVHPDIRHWYNCKTVAAMAKQMFNQEHTAPNKSLDLPTFFKINDADYLCRRFIQDTTPDGGGYIFAQLSLNSITTMVQYVHKHESMTKHQMMRINMDNALRELVYHGRDLYEQYQKTFNIFLRAVHQPLINTTYDENRKVMMLFKFG